jgi:hypothetical protein
MTCKHIYQHIGLEICPDCGKPTHDPDNKTIAQTHKQWVTDNPDYIPSGWTSI